MERDPSYMLRVAGRLAAAAERKERGGMSRERVNREYWDAMKAYRDALRSHAGANR